MKKNQIEKGIKYILTGIGAEGEEYNETPRRAAKMFMEMLAETKTTNAELAERFEKTFPAPANCCDVEANNIRCFSFCQHHLALIYDMNISIKYRPADRIIGLSKLSRIADAVCRRPQLQEKIASDIFEILSSILKTENIAITIEAKHSCVNARGANKLDTITRTELRKGVFEHE